MGQELNVEIFCDTKKMYETDEKLKYSVKNSISKQELILEHERVEVKENLSDKKTRIEVTKERSYQAAQRLVKEGYHAVCVHNFASAITPGGGVINGSPAQEECLCRCSTLYPCLSTPEMYTGFYGTHRQKGDPLYNADCIYTPDVTVFKTDTAAPELMQEKDWYQVNVITCAAPNLCEMSESSMDPHCKNGAEVCVTAEALYGMHVFRLQRILDIAYTRGNEAIVLGAFGCGAFQNSPRVAARAAKDVIKRNLGGFGKIVFAVYCSPVNDTNYIVFSTAFGQSI